MTPTAHMDGANRRRPLSADMFTPKQAPLLASLPDLERLARKLAEAQSADLSSLSSAPWRVTLDRIVEQAGLAPEDQSRWARAESAAGSITFHQGFDRPAISALCECAMGGTGTEAAFDFEDRPLSAIEKEIVQAVALKLASGIAEAFADQWRTPVSLFDGIIASDDPAATSSMLVMHFIANVFGYSGEIRIAMARAELTAQFDAAGGTVHDTSLPDRAKNALQQQIGKVDCLFTVMLGDESMLVEEITALLPGAHVRLAATTAASVVVSSGGTPVFTGSLARSGDRLAVRITSPDSSTPSRKPSLPQQS